MSTTISKNPPLETGQRTLTITGIDTEIRICQKREFLPSSSIEALEQMCKRSKRSKPFGKNISEVYCDAIYRIDANYELENQALREVISRNLSEMFKNSEAFDFVLKIIEDIALLLANLYHATTRQQYALAFAVYFKAVLGNKPMCGSWLVEQLTKICDTIVSDVNIFLVQSASDTSESVFKTARHVLDNFDTFRKRPLFKKIYKVIGLSLSMQCFNDMNNIDSARNLFCVVESEWSKRAWGADFVYSVCDMVIFVGERVTQCVKIGSFQPLLHSGKSYDDWIDNAQKIIQYKNYLSNPEAHAIVLPNYLSELDVMIQQGDVIKKFVEDKFDKRVVEKVLMELRAIKNTHIAGDAALEDRYAPFGVLIGGGTSIGKSSFMHFCFVHNAKVLGLPSDKKYRYTRLAGEAHWNNFKSYHHTVIVDDAGFMKPDVAKEGDPSVMEILVILNNIAFVPEQAALEDKGKTPMRSVLALFSTNTFRLNLDSYFSCPLAVMRRFPLILDLKPKAEYTKNGQFLDPLKIPQLEDGQYPNLWDIKVLECLPRTELAPRGDIRTNQSFKLVETCSMSNIYDFCTYFATKIVEHQMIQTKFLTSSDTLLSIDLCKTCYRPTGYCSCNNISVGMSGENVVLLNENIVNNASKETLVLFENHSRADFQMGVEVLSNANYGEPLSRQALEHMFSYNPVMTEKWVSDIAQQRLDAFREAEDIRIKKALQDNKPWFYQRWMVFIIKTIISWATEDDVNIFQRWTQLVITKCFFSLTFLGCALTYWTENPLDIKVSFKAIGHDLYQKYKPSGHLLKITACCSLIIASLGTVGWIMHFLFSSKDDVKTKSLSEEEYKERVAHVHNLTAPENGDVTVPMANNVMLSTISNLLVHGERPKSRPFERPEAWPRDPYKLTVADLSPTITSWKGLSNLQIANIVRKNIFKCEVVCHKGDEKYTRKGVILALTDFVYCLNWHTLEDVVDEFKIISWSIENTSANNRVEALMHISEVGRAAGDLAFVRFVSRPPCKSLVGLIPPKPVQGIYKGFLTPVDEDIIETYNVMSGMENLFFLAGLTYKMAVNNKTRHGQSGMPLILTTDLGPILAGIHACGSLETVNGAWIAVAQSLYKEDLDAFLLRNKVMSLDDSHVDLGYGIYKKDLTQVHFKHPINFTENCSVDVYGGVGGVKPSLRTKLRHSILRKSLERRGYSTPFIIPTKFNSWKPWSHGFNDRAAPKRPFPSLVIKAAVESYLANVYKKLPNEELVGQVYDVLTAINGVAGIAHVKSIDKNTSMGFPYNKCKKFFLEPVEDAIEGLPDAVVFTKEVMERINNLVEQYLAGKITKPIFTASLKDEVIKAEKDEEGRIRVFTGAPAEWVIVVRMYFLWAARIIQNNPFCFETSAAMNLTTVEWEVVYQYLTYFGLERLIAGDYGKFDTSQCPAIIIAAFSIIIDMAEKAGFSLKDLRVMYGIAIDTAFSMCNMWDVLLRWYGVMPSGCPLTLLINSIVNSLLMRIIYCLLNPLKECLSFNDTVHLLTLGDDNVMNVRDDISWFNHTDISQMFAVFGLKYTMADKTSQSVPFISISEAELAKRTWRFEVELNVHVSPLVETSIIKSLFFTRSTPHLTQEALAIDAIAGAMQEYFFYGREKYDFMMLLFKEIIVELDLQCYVKSNTFRTFDYWLNRFVKNSEHVRTKYYWIKREIVLPSSPGLGKGVVDSSETKTLPDELVTGLSKFELNCDSSVDFIRKVPRRSLKFLFRKGDGSTPKIKFKLSAGCVNCRILNRHAKQNTKKQNSFGSLESESQGTLNINEVLSELSLTPQVPEAPRSASNTPSSRRKNRKANHHMQALFFAEGKILDLREDLFSVALSAGLTRVEAYSAADSYINAIRVKYKESLVHAFKTFASYQGDFSPQSENTVVENENEGEAKVDQEVTMEFFDQTRPIHAGFLTTLRPKVDATDELYSLKNWFSRPLLINSHTWTVSQGAGSEVYIRPWNLFFDDAKNKFKMNNYAYFRCDLKLKITTNATQFLYGTKNVAYRPLANSIGMEEVYGPALTGSSLQARMIQLTQLPNLFIKPHENTVLEMTLPFLLNRNYLACTGEGGLATGAFNMMGILYFTVYNALQSANGGTTDGVTVNTFAWAENFEMVGPTCALANQSKNKAEKVKDEYTGKISKPASAIAAMAKWFTGIPIIGPFATATQMGATAVAIGASALGYTNVPTIEDVNAFRPTVTPGFANAEIGYPVERLTVDPKNELTIDNKAIGYNSHDELSLKSLLTRECVIGFVNWTQSVGEETALAKFTIAPFTYNKPDVGTYTQVAQAPLCYFSQLFDNWRGDIIFHFQVIASAYHKGRLRFVWDPAGDTANNIVNSSDPKNVVLSQVVDIGVVKDFEIRIPYMQAAEWCGMINLNEQKAASWPAYNNFAAIGTFLHQPNITNGTMVIYVLNELSGPVEAATVNIIVSVRGADNLEFANPTTNFGNNTAMSLFVPQSENSKEVMTMDFDNPSIPRPERYLTNFGEGYLSLRQILRRTTAVGRYTYRINSNSLGTASVTMTRFPLSYGWDPAGFSLADKQFSVAVGPFNYTTLHPLTWVQSCFLGVRGSVNWYMNAIASLNGYDQKVTNFVVSRGSYTSTGLSLQQLGLSTTGNNGAARDWYTRYVDGASGCSVTDSRVQPMMAVSFPNYNQFFFNGTGRTMAGAPSAHDGSFNDLVNVSFNVINDNSADAAETSSTAFLSMYAGIGTDYNVVCFLHTPTIFWTNGVPTAEEV